MGERPRWELLSGDALIIMIQKVRIVILIYFFLFQRIRLGTLSISDDLTKSIPNKADQVNGEDREGVGVGDLRGTKEGWHLTAQSSGLTQGSESLDI